VKDDANLPVKRISDIFEPRLAGVASWLPAQPNVALMCLWQTSTNRYSKKLYMRGVPAGLGDLGKAPNFGFGAFASNFNSYREAMRLFSAGWQVTAPTQTTMITAYVFNQDTGQVTFTLMPGFVTWPVAFGKVTRVYVKIPGKSALDGAIMVVPTSLTSCYTAEAHPAGPLPIGQVGTMEQRTATLVTLGGLSGSGGAGIIHPQRMVTHKTGRPSYASRGRRSEVVRW